MFQSRQNTGKWSRPSSLNSVTGATPVGGKPTCKPQVQWICLYLELHRYMLVWTRQGGTSKIVQKVLNEEVMLHVDKLKSHHFVQFLFQVSQKEVRLWNNTCVAWSDDVGSSRLTYLKVKWLHTCAKPFCSWLGPGVGPTHQLLQRGRQAPEDNINK